MRDVLRSVHVEHATDAAAIDRLAAYLARVERVAAKLQMLSVHFNASARATNNDLASSAYNLAAQQCGEQAAALTEPEAPHD